MQTRKHDGLHERKHNMMKHICKILAVAALLLVAAVAVTGCSQWTPIYEQMDNDGYTVSVRFDANGGIIGGGTSEVYVVDVFNVGDFKADGEGIVHIPLLPLEHESRKKGSENLKAEKNGYFLAGWYTERTPRVNENGEPLDEFGQLTSVSGREQGYVYGNKWDFSKDRVDVDTKKEHSAGTNVMTLYAGWVPYFDFEFYAVNEDGDATLLSRVEDQIQVELPEWDLESGKMNMKEFPAREGMTFEAAFLDEAMTLPAGGMVGIPVDYETGTFEGDGTIRIYTTWQEGTWFRISTPKQLFDNASPNGCYILEKDLNFEGQLWPTIFSTGEFNGIIQGNGHTISNVDVLQGDNSKLHGGLFGTLEATAEILDLKLENVTYRIEAGSRMKGTNYGLLAGTVNQGATLTDVSITGMIEVGKNCYHPNEYSIGLLCGSGNIPGIDTSGITVTVEDPENTSAQVEVNRETGEVTLTFTD